MYIEKVHFYNNDPALPVYRWGLLSGVATDDMAAVLLKWLPTIPESVKLLSTHSPVTKLILNTPKTGQCEYFQEGYCCTYITKNRNKISVAMVTRSFYIL